MNLRFTNSSKSSSRLGLTESVFQLLAKVYGNSPWSRDQIQSDLIRPESLYFLVYDGQVLVGFMATQTVLDELEITNLAILPSHQRKGLAGDLLNHLTLFKGSLFLEVRESNEPARKLYEKFGFSQFNRRKAYYTNPVEDALLLRKEQLNF